jgi:hypothetical protein
MRVCTRCGNVATGQQRYCTRCVAPLDPPEPPDARLPASAEPWWADDPAWADPQAFDDWFTGGEAATSVMPLLVDDPAPDEYWEQPSRGGRLYYPSADPRHASAGRRAQIASAALAAVALLAGTVTAWAAFGHHPRAASSGARLSSSQTTATRRASVPSPRPAASGHPSTAAPPSTVRASTAPPPGAGSGFTVLLAPGVSQNPAAAQVDGLLVTYFTAINSLNFRQYASTFLPQVRHQLSAAAFTSGYKSSRDSNVSLVGIAAAQHHRIAVTVTFTSTQKPHLSSGVTSCTYWAITLFLGRHGQGYLIGAPPAKYHPYHHACD